MSNKTIIIVSILLLRDIYLGCFRLLAIMDKAAMNIVKQVSLWHGGTSYAQK